MKIILTFVSIAVFISIIFAGCNKKGSTPSPTPTLTPTLATVTTTPISTITGIGAICGGNISSDGGAQITARGVVWSTNSGATIRFNPETVDSTGIGNYKSSITGLIGLTTYYVRAYATNSVGTAYGNELTFTTLFGVGASSGGGIVAYILQPGDPGYNPSVQHGLIVAPSDQTTLAGVKWSNGSTIVTGATGSAIGTGLSNTIAIIAAQGPGSYAATLCRNLSIGGYSDWYLPSINELDKIYQNQAAISGFNGGMYWSSSEFSSDVAWAERFSDGSQFNDGSKSSSLLVRAIRSF